VIPLMMVIRCPDAIQGLMLVVPVEMMAACLVLSREASDDVLPCVCGLQTLSEHQEVAFRRLHNWILQRCSGMEGDEEDMDMEENDAVLALGLKTIRERPALYAHCQECLIGRRKELVRRRFMQAMTQVLVKVIIITADIRGARWIWKFESCSCVRQGAKGSLRPIEMQAHDSVRYVGDILAWLHQTIASEREFLLNVLGGSVQDANAPPSQAPDPAGEDQGEQKVGGTGAGVMFCV
jgi:conserved oligomeric Golgi complex subunit 6